MAHNLWSIRIEILNPNLFCNIKKEGCYVIGITGGSASGKTSVAKKIIEGIDIPWVVLLSMDSFYKGISTEGKSFIL